MRNRRGDTTSNVILFLAVLIVGGVLVSWYLGTVRPTRATIAGVNDDAREIVQHVLNACSSTTYRAIYRVTTPNLAVRTNGTHICLATDVFGTCRPAACEIAAETLTLADRPVLAIERDERDTAPNETASIRIRVQ